MPTVQEGSSMTTIVRKVDTEQWSAVGLRKVATSPAEVIESLRQRYTPDSRNVGDACFNMAISDAITITREYFAVERVGQLEWLTDLLEVLQEAKTDADRLGDAEAAVKAAIKLYQK